VGRGEKKIDNLAEKQPKKFRFEPHLGPGKKQTALIGQEKNYRIEGGKTKPVQRQK